GLVIEVAGNDEAVVEKLGLRIDSDVVAHVDPERQDIRVRIGQGIDAQLDVVPPHRLRVDLLVERMSRCLQRQDRATEAAPIREDRHPRAFRETGRPVPDRNQFEAATILYELDLCSERIEMRHDCPGGATAATLLDDAYGASPGQFRHEAEPLQLLRAVAYDLVRETRRAWDQQELLQLAEQIGVVDFQGRASLSQGPLGRTASRLIEPGPRDCGKRRSTNRCAVG